MRVSFDVEVTDLSRNLDAILTKVGRNTRKGTIEACMVISEESLKQVPRQTDTLASSQFWEVTGSYKIGWTGTIGYGGNGDPINPRTGLPASKYMVKVHEDLSAYHPIGKAKFLEDPVRSYAATRFPRTVYKYLREALGGN